MMNDLISRQAAIDAVMECYENDELFEVYEDRLNSLPSAQPKKGKWIYHIDDLFPAESTQECDQCHEHQPLTIDDNFCPNCGAKMEG